MFNGKVINSIIILCNFYLAGLVWKIVMNKDVITLYFCMEEHNWFWWAHSQ